jgi:hypothetical protein
VQAARRVPIFTARLAASLRGSLSSWVPAEWAFVARTSSIRREMRHRLPLCVTIAASRAGSRPHGRFANQVQPIENQEHFASFR